MSILKAHWKFAKNFLNFRHLDLNWLQEFLPIRKGILVIGSQHVNKQDSRSDLESRFSTQLIS